MEAYEIFKIKDDKPENCIDPYRQLMDQLLTRADSLISAGNNDVASKIKGELMLGRTIFGDSNEAIEEFFKDAAYTYKNLSIADQRNTDTTLRDIINSFGDEIASNGDVVGKKQYMDILDEYLEFKTNIDTVSPEAAAEVDRLAAMSDEEFEAEMNKPDEDEEEDSDELDTPILQDDFDNLSVKELVEKYGAHDTALCLIGAEGGDKKFSMDDMYLFDTDDQELLRQEFGTSPDAPNTAEYNPDYDIPDEKLYPQE